MYVTLDKLKMIMELRGLSRANLVNSAGLWYVQVHDHDAEQFLELSTARAPDQPRSFRSADSAISVLYGIGVWEFRVFCCRDEDEEEKQS